MVADADDTAKCIYTLQLLNQNPDPRPMFLQFQTAGVFKTYSTERTSSLSTNCNVLKTLLVLPDADQHLDSVRIALDFICEACFAGRVTDKWVSSSCQSFRAELTSLRMSRMSTPTCL
jgi:hypothetical protein